MPKHIRKPNPLPDHPKPESRMHTPVGVSFMRVTAGADFCLSVCTQDEVRGYVDCLRQLTMMTWQQVLQTSRKGPGKTGLAYTRYPDDALKRVGRPAWLSRDIDICAVRASERTRLYGYYLNHVFYVLWFDREHCIVPV